MPFSMSSIKNKLMSRPVALETNSRAVTSDSTPAASFRIALPLYIYPAPGAWNAVFDVVATNESVYFDIVINPHNGPGGSVPDGNYISNISKLNSYSNVKLFGYVHTSWGERDLDHIATDIRTYESWSSYKDADIHVQGIFFDEAPSTLSCLAFMREVYQNTKSTLTKGNTVWTNPGTVVDGRFFAVADLINTFEDNHANWQTITHTPQEHRTKSTVMIHTYQGSATTLEEDVAWAIAAGYRSGLFTTRSGYESLSSMWTDLADLAAV